MYQVGNSMTIPALEIGGWNWAVFDVDKLAFPNIIIHNGVLQINAYFVSLMHILHHMHELSIHYFYFFILLLHS